MRQRLGTTEQVIKNYLRSVYDKTGVSDRLELALFTIHHRILNEAAAATAAAATPQARLRVLVDAVEDGVALARSEGDAPQIDGVVRIPGSDRRGRARLRAGEFADVEIVAADDYDLTGRLTG